MMLFMPGLIRASAVAPAAKPAKSVEQASRRPPLVAQASSLSAAPARCDATINFLKQPCRVRMAHLGHAQASRLCHHFSGSQAQIGNGESGHHSWFPSSCLGTRLFGQAPAWRKYFPHINMSYYITGGPQAELGGQFAFPSRSLGTSPSWASGPPKAMKLATQAFQPVPGHPRAGVLHFQKQP